MPVLAKLQGLERKEDFKDAVDHGPAMPIVFQVDQVDFNGIETSVPGWEVKIQPRTKRVSNWSLICMLLSYFNHYAMAMQITWAAVNKYNGEGHPPMCVLTANKCTSSTPPDLKYEVALDGAKPPNNLVVVERRAEVELTCGGGAGAMERTVH